MTPRACSNWGRPVRLRSGHGFYWPELGRFISQDPIGDGVNWYAYVGNNPVVGVDPEGLDYLDIGASIGWFGKGVMGGVKLGHDPCAEAKPWRPWAPSTWRNVHPYAGAGTGWGPRIGATYLSGTPSTGPWAGFSGTAGIPILAGIGPSATLGGSPSGPGAGVGVGWGLGFFQGVSYTW